MFSPPPPKTPFIPENKRVTPLLFVSFSYVFFVILGTTMFSLGVGVFFGFILLLLLKRWRNIDNPAMVWCRRINLVLCVVVVIMLPWWMILLNILFVVVLAVVVLKTRLARWVLPWA